MKGLRRLDGHLKAMRLVASRHFTPSRGNPALRCSATEADIELRSCVQAMRHYCESEHPFGSPCGRLKSTKNHCHDLRGSHRSAGVAGDFVAILRQLQLGLMRALR